MKKFALVITCLIAGGFVGFHVGNWWLYRTVESPELETAIYPVTGMIVGCIIGLLVGIYFALPPPPDDFE